MPPAFRFLLSHVCHCTVHEQLLLGFAGCECVICMNPADVGQPAARMVTPCNHFFHNHCLERWMDV